MRLTALALLGALSVFAVGCSAEETDGSKVVRPSIGQREGSDDTSDPSETASTTGSTETDNSGVAKPITPNDTTTTTTTPAADPGTPAIQTKPIPCNTDEDSVTNSYRIALQRQPDPGGLQNWVSAIQNGDTRLGVLNKIIASEEFASVHAGLTNDEFLSFLYNSFFGRSADEGGRQSWLNALNNGQSRASVAQAFANSEEFKSPNSNKAVACYF